MWTKRYGFGLAASFLVAVGNFWTDVTGAAVDWLRQLAPSRSPLAGRCNSITVRQAAAGIVRGVPGEGRHRHRWGQPVRMDGLGIGAPRYFGHQPRHRRR